MTGNPLGKISHELWLMLASAGGDIAKTRNLLIKPVNWNLLLQLALHHRVYPLIYKTLSQLKNPTIPKNTLDYLQQKYQENAMQVLTMAGETVRMIKCFESHGIPAVVLKGPPLAWRLYGDVSIRPSKDIDILVSPGEFVKAQGILNKEGYRRIDIHIKYPEQNFTSRQLEILKRARDDFHVNYWHSENHVNIEVHWRLGKSIYELPFPNENNITRIGMAGNLIPVLRDEDWLLYLMFHGASHAWFRLRWLVDIAKFTQQKGIDWEKIAFMAKNIGMQYILYQSLILANGLLNAPVPANFQAVVTSDRSACRLSYMAVNVCLSTAEYEIWGSNGQSKGCWKRIYFFHMRRGWKNRFNYILKELKKLFMPSSSDFMFISLPDRFFGLYYVIRPFYVLYRQLKKSRTKAA